MHTIFLNASDYATARELHASLKLLLDLPDHYGHNADALHDCLSERRDRVSLVVTGQATGEVEHALSHCMTVIRDLGGQIIRR